MSGVSAIGREHPSADQLTRFVCAKSPRVEVRAIVRHLLTDCRRCRESLERIRAANQQKVPSNA